MFDKNKLEANPSSYVTNGVNSLVSYRIDGPELAGKF